MTNPNDVPTLSIRRPVLNIGQAEHIEPLQARLLEAIGSEAEDQAFRDLVAGIFNPSHELYSSIITKGEFKRIQHRLGENRLDERQVEQLANAALRALAGRPEEVKAKTMPTKFLLWGNWPKCSIGIAQGEPVVKERQRAKKAILEAVGRDVLDLRWFSQTNKIVPVQLASASTKQEAKYLKKALDVIHKRKILPLVTEFGMIEVRISSDPMPRHPGAIRPVEALLRNGDTPDRNGWQ